MNALIVYWHPEPKSFNHALFATACDTLQQCGANVQTSDLHAMAFDPISSRRNFKTVYDPEFLKLQLEERRATEQQGFADDLETEMRKVEACELMIWQFPLWWFGLPAALKGWVDRVFAAHRFYGGKHVYQNGPMKGRRALLSLTTGGPSAVYEPGGFNGDLSAILRPIHRGIFEFVGFQVLAPHVVYGPAHLSDVERQTALAGYAARLRGISSESPIEVGPY